MSVDEYKTSNELAWVEAAFRPAGRVFDKDDGGDTKRFWRLSRPCGVHTTRCEKLRDNTTCGTTSVRLRGFSWLSRRHESASWKTESEILATVANKLARAHVVMPPTHL